MKKKTIKKRNPTAFDLFTNGLYKQKVIKNKKAYNRKKLKKGKELLKCLSLIFIYIFLLIFLFFQLLFSSLYHIYYKLIMIVKTPI